MANAPVLFVSPKQYDDYLFDPNHWLAMMTQPAPKESTFCTKLWPDRYRQIAGVVKNYQWTAVRFFDA